MSVVPPGGGGAGGAGGVGDGEAWVRVCEVAAVSPEHPVGVALRGEDQTGRVCVVAGPDGPLAMLDRCPHRDIRVSGGVVREGLLTCPGHFWRFSLTDGRRTDEPDQVLSLYPTRVTPDGWVEALLPPPTPRLSMREWLLEQARQRG